MEELWSAKPSAGFMTAELLDIDMDRAHKVEGGLTVKPQKTKTMDSRKSVQNLAETIHSLLGLKAHVTSSWVKSVCDIMKNLQSEKPSTDLKPAKLETMDSFDNKDADSGNAISKIKDDLAALTAHINQLNIERRQVLNEFLDLKGNIRVFCRIRPITVRETFGRSRPVVASDSSNVLLRLDDNKSKSYSFDKVFHPGSSQDEVFSEVEPVIKSVLDGYNACIFAYGQTGTGKTFTMEGTPDSPGIVSRAIEALFKQAVDSNHAFLISFSMLEIYLGNLKDLLVTQPTKATDPMPPCLSIHTDPKGGTEIENLVAIQVSDFNQALRLYRLGCRFRSTASTNSNTTSSRSHCMIRISITCFDAPERRRETNKIWLVDLGGSERVLKTKAWGRRLDEGKAINLSLSALGDVINALQRKKRHIPYRNSKLTQVLKDSLGEDSKTLMLVHVSPKEEDLCETICSLNFATRVKGIHLGHEDSNEVREQKEVAMMDLQQKIKKIEDERLHLRRDIQKLNENLENLTRTALSSEEKLEASHLSTEESHSGIEVLKGRIADVTAAPLSHLPRFMRPTICSRRKSGTEHQTSKWKDPILARRRRPLSHRAESVTFPVKNNSEYNSEHSISGASCLVGLNMKNSADNETEYSQDTSECDIKMVVFPEQEESQRTIIRQGAHLSHLEKYGNKKTNQFNSTKLLKVDNWLHLHKNESSISGYTRRSKQVLAIPTPDKKNRGNGQNKAEKLLDGNESTYNFTMQKVVRHNKMEKQGDMGEVGRSISEVMTDKPPTMLKDLFYEDSRSNFTCPSHVTDGQKMIQTQDLADGSSIANNEFGTLSPTDGSCGRFNQYEDDDRIYVMSIMQVVKGETEPSDGFMLKNSGCQFSPSQLDNSFTDSKDDSGVSISISEMESPCQQVRTEMDIEDSKKKELDASPQPSTTDTRPGLLKLKSKRALFMDNANRKDLTVPLVKLQESTDTKGIFCIIKQKSQILWASALLGLGLHDLGLEHDFFHGLML